MSKEIFDIPKEELEKFRKTRLDDINSQEVIEYKNPDGIIQELIHSPFPFTMLDKATVVKTIGEATNVGGLILIPEVLGAMKAPSISRVIFPVRKVHE